MLKWVNIGGTIGAGEHRSGWPYVLDAIKPLYTENATVVLDDFTERTFLYNWEWHKNSKIHDYPWIAVFHHPPDIPLWYSDQLQIQKLAHQPRFQQSLPNLKMIIGLAPNFVDFARKEWPGIPVVTMKHPTGRPILKWSPEAYDRNQNKKLLQVGWFLRNTQAIFQVKAPQFKKVFIKSPASWVHDAHVKCYRYYTQIHPERIPQGKVEEIMRVSDIQFDLLLSQNVVFMEVLTAAANNTVVECITRNTPICINRHPGPEYYLGKNYPLFYNRFSQVAELLTRPRIMAAHRHLKLMDKSWIRGGMFREHLRSVCLEHVPETRGFTTPVNDQPRFTL